MHITAEIIGLCVVIILLNYIYNAEKPIKQYTAISGDLKGQTHTIEDWRKIAVELSKTVKNNTMHTRLKYGSDEDIIGLLYLNYGIDLIDADYK